MRIITGSARNTPLNTLPGDDITRPTPERAKEAVFSMIQFDIEGRAVLDLFAGSGQLGLEALSRGAEKCDFVDLAPEAIAVIKENIKKTKFIDRTSVFTSDYKIFIKNAAKKSSAKYSLIFLDPPYTLGAVPEAIALLDSGGLIADGGLIVCETGEELPLKRPGFATLKRAKYGTVHMTVYEKMIV